MPEQPMTAPADMSEADLIGAVTAAESSLSVLVPRRVFAARESETVPAIIAAERVLQPLAEEWLLRSTEQALGMPVGRVDVGWDSREWPPVYVEEVFDVEGRTLSGPLWTLRNAHSERNRAVTDDGMTRALFALANAWNGTRGGHLTLAR